MVIVMDKILVLVYIPSIEEEYEVYIPINKKIGTIKKVIIDAIIELSDGNIKSDEKFQLYDKDITGIYNNNLLVKDSGIKNGSKLVLM